MSIKSFASVTGKATAPLGCVMAIMLSVALATAAPSRAAGTVNHSCVETNGSFVCAETWSEGRSGFPRIVNVPRSQEEATAVAERERSWLARCQPVIQYDRYGVGRYHYKAAGCEFGRIGN
jgi:hypothetical protein